MNAIDDTDAIFRRSVEIAGYESGVCLKGTAEQPSCWCYRAGPPSFDCPKPVEAPQSAATAPIGVHDLQAPTPVPWFGVVV